LARLAHRAFFAEAVNFSNRQQIAGKAPGAGTGTAGARSDGTLIFGPVGRLAKKNMKPSFTPEAIKS
jgi:hypothetical protein